MKRYEIEIEIEIDETVADFFKEVALIVKRPIEEILSDALFKQVEIISRKISKSTVIND